MTLLEIIRKEKYPNMEQFTVVVHLQQVRIKKNTHTHEKKGPIY
jgi:hypothetical protein